VREKAADYGLELLHSDWRDYDANHVVSRTRGASVEALQAVADRHHETMERYLRYQDHLNDTGQLEGYEQKIYLLRRRQSLLWKLLLGDVIEGFTPFRDDPVAELERAVSEATGVDPDYAAAEVQRVLDLGALVPRETPEGTRFEWLE
jgi:hypothetical protein